MALKYSITRTPIYVKSNVTSASRQLSTSPRERRWRLVCTLTATTDGAAPFSPNIIVTVFTELLEF
jgi:hypothetical protein